MSEYIIITAQDSSERAQQLRTQYYALRKRAFEARWGDNFYPDGPDTYDQRPETTYVLNVEENKVIAGGRLVFHAPGSNDQVPMEVNHPALALHKLLPHLDSRNLAYCEMTGAVVDPDDLYQGQHLGTEGAKKRLELLKSGAISQNGKKVDVIVSAVSNTNLGAMVRAANEAGMTGIIREDLVAQEEDSRFNTKIWPVLFNLNPDINLVTEDMHTHGAKAASISGYLMPQDRYSNRSFGK